MDEDIGALQGTWSVVALEVEGMKMPAAMLTGSKIVVNGQNFTTIAMGATYEGTLEVDSAATPKTFQLKFTVGPEQGNTSLGIYELDGDTWRICLTTTGKNRPKEFATAPGSGLALETLQRSRPSDVEPDHTAADHAPESAGPPLDPAEDLSGEWDMVSGVLNGQPMEKSMVRYGKRVIRGNQTTVSFGPQVFMKATVTMDHSKRPKTIDYLVSQGGAAGSTLYGIYEVTGDTVTICYAAAGQERPADFASNPGDGRTFAVWKLVKR